MDTSIDGRDRAAEAGRGLEPAVAVLDGAITGSWNEEDLTPGSGEIFRRLAAALGSREPELFASDRKVIDELLHRTGFGVGWDALAMAGTVRLYETPTLQFADLTFATPSGRVEVASDTAEAAGQPRLPEPWHDPQPVQGRLRLLSQPPRGR